MHLRACLNRPLSQIHLSFPMPTTTIPDIGQLNTLATRGLVRMFDEREHLFCNRLVLTGHGLTREGLSPRYTIMSTLGLWRWKQAGDAAVLDVEAILARLLRDTRWLDNIGDLGLLIWLVALCAPERLGEISARFRLGEALRRFRDAREGRTMEIAWFLAGISHALLSGSSKSPALSSLAADASCLLQKNQGSSGIFGHSASRGSLSGMLRGRIGSFADQVYPIYALSRLAQACNDKESLAAAQRCASALVAVQGSLGQWWWLYDADSGSVVRRYPVYSVHQEGMGPMALFALEEASNHDFRDAIYRGLSWIGGNNELGADLRDPSSLVVWRCIRPKRQLHMHLDDVRHFLGVPRQGHGAGDLVVLRECRPYELGWLLYAFAPHAGHEHGGLATGAGRSESARSLE